jgi:vacuolar-type H+-ATPase subunit I/STV1
MSKKQEPEPESPSEKVSSTQLDMLEMQERLKRLEDFSIETREVAVLHSQSLPHIMHQFKKGAAANLAVQQSLLIIEKEASQRYTSFESAMRTASREGETSRRIKKYLDSALLHYRMIADENIALKEEKKKLEIEIEAKQKVIDATQGFLGAITQLIEAKKQPADVLAEVRRIMKEAPQPLAPPQQPTSIQESEGEEEEGP